MALKKNCWEQKNCGREPGGPKAADLGACPAATNTAAHGTNAGTNGGRICWAISGTLCGGDVQGTFAEKEVSCMNCEVFRRVKDEEGTEFSLRVPSGMPVRQD